MLKASILQEQDEDKESGLIQSLCQSVLSFNKVIDLSEESSISDTGINTLRTERDRLASQLYGLMRHCETGLFLVSVLLYQEHIPFVAEVNHSNQTVYFHSFLELERYGDWD